MVSAITNKKPSYFMCEISKRIKMCLNDPQIWQFIFQAKLQDHLKEKNLCYMCACVYIYIYKYIYIERDFAQKRLTFLRR